MAAMLALCLALLILLVPRHSLAQETPAAVSTPDTPPATLTWGNRSIVTFRGALLGDEPAERALLARASLKTALERATASGAPSLEPQRVPMGAAIRYEWHGVPLFYLTVDDMGGPRPEADLEPSSLDVLARLRVSAAEHLEAADAGALWRAAGRTLAASAAALALLWGILRLRRVALGHIRRRIEPVSADHGGPKPTRSSWFSSYLELAGSMGRVAATALAWLLAVVVVEAWVSYALHQFPYTRPWGERSTAWLLEVLGQFALSTAQAVPGLLVAGLIFVLARVAVRAAAALLRRAERGEVQVPWLDADTVVPTRRLATVGIWLFALAMAYPYLPGAHSEAFKGVTVLAGLMLSLGASSVVGQALSGLSLMYSRSVRTGEYVKVGDTEGTVVTLGMFTTRIQTGMGEEVSVPNSVMFSQPIRNFSRLVNDGHFVLHTTVTIGYATPWRQVHAMLLEAARRTPAVAAEPAPYVVQTALSDFYVEYRLCAQSGRNAPQRRAEAMNQLHANVQDVFNENSVQIMSPHYRGDPPEPQVVPPGPWASRSSPGPFISPGP